MSFENPHSPIENQVSDYEIRPEEDFDAHSQRIADIRYQEEIEQENIGDPDDILKALDESDKGVAQSPESHKGGGIDNLPIEQQIAQIKLKIQTLEANFNSLTDQQLNELLELYERKSELENQQSSMIAQQIRENEATIDTKTETLHSAQEIQRFLNADIRSQFSDIDALLNPADNLLATLQEGGLLTQAENRELAAITRDALNYLKSNRSELTTISREIQAENPQNYLAFKDFLISQDAEF